MQLLLTCVRQAYDFAEQVKVQGREAANRFREHISVVVMELAKKEMCALSLRVVCALITARQLMT